jgi:hypothetical protein
VLDGVPGIGALPAGAATVPWVDAVPGIGGRPLTETGAAPLVDAGAAFAPAMVPMAAPLPLGTIPVFVGIGVRPPGLA